SSDGLDGAAISEDGRFLYVAASNGHAIEAFDTTTGDMVGYTYVENSMPIGVAVSPNSTLVYASFFSDSTVKAIDVTSLYGGGSTGGGSTATASVGTPNKTTGVVKGSITASDPNKLPL